MLFNLSRVRPSLKDKLCSFKIITISLSVNLPFVLIELMTSSSNDF